MRSRPTLHRDPFVPILAFDDCRGRVPAQARGAVPFQGARTPSVRMADSHTNRDGCDGPALTLTDTGSAYS